MTKDGEVGQIFDQGLTKDGEVGQIFDQRLAKDGEVGQIFDQRLAKDREAKSILLHSKLILCQRNGNLSAEYQIINSPTFLGIKNRCPYLAAF